MSVAREGIPWVYVQEWHSWIWRSTDSHLSVRNCLIDFHSDCMSLHTSPPPCMCFPLTPHPHKQELSPVFMICAILTGVRQILKVVLIFIFLRRSILNISLSVSWSFEFPFLRILCLELYLIFKLSCFIDIQFCEFLIYFGYQASI